MTAAGFKPKTPYRHCAAGGAVIPTRQRLAKQALETGIVGWLSGAQKAPAVEQAITAPADAAGGAVRLGDAPASVQLRLVLYR